MATPQTQKKDDTAMGDILEGNSPAVISLHPGDIVDGRVISKDKRGVLVDIGGTITGIISGRELVDTFNTAKDLKVGDQVSVFVLEDENENGMTVLSLRKAAQARAWDHFQKIKEDGGTVEAVAKMANKGGLMTEVNGVTAFLPVSQLAPHNYPRVDGANAEAILAKLEKLVGQKFSCKIILLDQEIGKVVISEREAMADIRTKEMEKLQVGEVVEGEVNGLVKFGVFMTFGNLEGLIHISELTWTHVKNPTELYKMGDKLKAQVIGIEGHKISLSVKRLMPDPWKDKVEKYKVGSMHSGVINKVTNYGVFVTLEEEVNGLVHTSEFVDEGVDPEKRYKEGDGVEVKILEVLHDDHSLKLSFKDTSEADEKPKKTTKKKAEQEEKESDEAADEKDDADEKTEKETTKKKKTATKKSTKSAKKDDDKDEEEKEEKEEKQEEKK